MESVFCKIGNRQMYIPASQKLKDLMVKCLREVNRKKRIARSRKAYYGFIDDDCILVSPSYFFVFEEMLDELKHEGIIHKLFFEFEKDVRHSLLLLLREGMSMKYLVKFHHVDCDALQEAVNTFFRKLSESI